MTDSWHVEPTVFSVDDFMQNTILFQCNFFLMPPVQYVNVNTAVKMSVQNKYEYFQNLPFSDFVPTQI